MGGYAGWYFGKPGSVSSATIDNVTIDDLQTTPTLAISPGSVLTSSTGNALTLTGVGTGWSGTHPAFTVSGGSIAAQSVASDTAATLTYTAPAGAGVVTVTDPSTAATAVLTVAAAATGFSLTPASLSTTAGAATASYSVALNGGLGAGETIALSDGGGGGTFTPASPLTFTPANAGGAQTFTYRPAAGSAGATFTLTATGAGAFGASHTASCVVGAGPVTIAVNDANLFLSPYNWRLNGSSYAVTAANGAYAKLGFTGTGVTLDLDVTAYGALYGNAALWPKIRWSVDNAASTTQQLDSSSARIALAGGLAAGAHSLFLTLVATTDGYDRWTVPLSALKLLGFTIDSGAASVAATLNPLRVVIDGDSITEGVKTTGVTSAGDITNNDSQLEWAAILGKALGAEYGQTGYGGLGWVVASAGNASPPGAPAYFTPGNAAASSWSQYSAGHSKLIGGLYSPEPDMIFVCLGGNDRNSSQSAVTASAQGWLSAARAAAPDAWLFLVVPFDGSARAALASAFTAYQAASPDPRAVAIDTHTDSHLNFLGAATDASGDGIHPSYLFTGQLAAMVAKAAQAAVAAAATTGNPGIQSHQLKRAR